MSKIKSRKFLTSKGFLMLIALFIFIIILTFFFGEGGILEIINTQSKIKDLEDQIQELEREKVKLKREIQELKDNPLALEKKAREKLWLMKKSEKVVVIVKDKKGEKRVPKKEE